MSSPTNIDFYNRGLVSRGFATQRRVIAALILREMHTRYGRDNIGYIWLVAEPMLLATVIGLMHLGQHTEYTNAIPPVPLAILGYTIFIMFRGIVNRSEGAMEANAPLLYHRMVTVDDVVISRALLETGGGVANVFLMIALMIAVGFAEFPARPLFLLLAIFYQFWLSWGQSMLIVTISHDNRTIGRLVHMYTYFMIPLSGAFFQVEWLPQPFRSYLLWSPFPHMFELARYGMFEAANLDYVDFQYLTAWSLGLTLAGLCSLRILRRHIHVH
jgi:capsular polysaccharide transport system permease protein